MLLSATSSEIISQKFDEAGKYLLKAKPLAEKRNENTIYPVFLLMKGIYCNYISANGNGNEEIIKKGWTDRLASIFKKNKTSSEKFKEEAETCFLEILNIERDANGDKSIGYAQGLYRVASFYIEQGDKIKAHELLVEAKQICEKYKATNIHLYYAVLLAFTISEYSLKGYETVKNNLAELEQYHFNKLIANYAFLTEKEREAYKNLIDNNIAPINSVYIATNSSDTREKMYNNIIATKEIALYANENIRNYIGTLNDSLQKEFYSIIKQRDSIEIDKNIVAGENQEARNDILLKEKVIQNKISSMPGFKQFDPRSIKWNNIRDALKENEIAIEFVHSNINKMEQYYALIIKKDLSAPELIPLFEGTDLKKLLNQPGNSKDRTNAIYGKLKDSLYSFIWKPLEEKLVNIQKVYVSVSGILYSVSLPAILTDKNIDVILLGSTRQVAIKTEENGQKYSSAVLIGGVNYGKTVNSADKAGNNRSNYTNLPFTVREIQEINKIFTSKRPEIKVDLVTDYSANEASFRNLEKRKPNLIHIATHGYYYPGDNFGSSNLLTDIYLSTNLSPMLRSGIILAGANNRKESNTENDGFLSAQEISRLNFANLDLAVLSACETGLGETIGSEGVFGLQRAFKQAGTKSLIMSLWKVPDEQTAELMTFFYSNYFNGMTKSQALKKAQLSMKTKYNAPFTWGGFILLER
jgi:CHAT domain-containing protein